MHEKLHRQRVSQACDFQDAPKQSADLSFDLMIKIVQLLMSPACMCIHSTPPPPPHTTATTAARNRRRVALPLLRSPHAPFERPRLDSPRSCKSAHKCKALHLEVGASPRASPNLTPIPCTGSAAYVIRETRSETYLLAAERRSGRGHFHLRTDDGGRDLRG